MSCNENYSKKIDEELKNRFKNTFMFFIDIYKFILLLRKDIYPYEFMNDWEKINEISLLKKEEFYKRRILLKEEF